MVDNVRCEIHGIAPSIYTEIILLLEYTFQYVLHSLNSMGSRVEMWRFRLAQQLGRTRKSDKILRSRMIEKSRNCIIWVYGNANSTASKRETQNQQTKNLKKASSKSLCLSAILLWQLLNIDHLWKRLLDGMMASPNNAHLRKCGRRNERLHHPKYPSEHHWYIDEVLAILWDVIIYWFCSQQMESTDEELWIMILEYPSGLRSRILRVGITVA